MILYHCSPYHIKSFEIPANGLHFGSIVSALCAGLRKILHKPEVEHLYLHKCELHDTTNNLREEDQGEDWSSVISEMKLHNKSWCRYKNKYEPSLQNSWLTIDPNLVTILSIDKLSYQKAFEMLEDLEEQELLHVEDCDF